MIKLDKHYTDPRLVDLYDLENPLGSDHDFFQRLIKAQDAKTIVDLGCGTGWQHDCSLYCQISEYSLPNYFNVHI